MKNFDKGDRVSHPTHGEGTVFESYDGTDWPTVQFDGGPKLMTHKSFLTLLPLPQAVPFKNGDRVQHSVHGFAGVLRYDEARKLVEIVPDGYGGNSCHVHPVSLTLVPDDGTVGETKPKFKIGDRVSHPLHRDGVIEDIDGFNGLHTVNVGGNSAYYALEHQITLAVPEPMFTIAVTDTDGWRATAGPYPKDQIDALWTGGFDWSTVQTVTINRVTKNAQEGN